jgi:hypothetical protein
MRRLLLLMLSVATAGCGPIEYISVCTFQASRAIAGAKGARAEKLAPYEYTAAVEYLHKARELGGFARYQQSIAFGRKAKELGDQAREIARAKASAPEAKHE